jgi:hypothetical protein
VTPRLFDHGAADVDDESPPTRHVPSRQEIRDRLEILCPNQLCREDQQTLSPVGDEPDVFFCPHCKLFLKVVVVEAPRNWR